MSVYFYFYYYLYEHKAYKKQHNMLYNTDTNKNTGKRNKTNALPFSFFSTLFLFSLLLLLLQISSIHTSASNGTSSSAPIRMDTLVDAEYLHYVTPDSQWLVYYWKADRDASYPRVFPFLDTYGRRFLFSDRPEREGS